MAGGSLPFVIGGEVAAPLGWLGRAAASGAIGASGPAADANAHGQDVGQAAVEGGLAGAGGSVSGDLLGNGLGWLGRKLAGALKSKPNIPTAAGIQAAKNAAYDRSEAAGDMATPEGLQRLKSNIANTMAHFGYDPGLQPGGQAVVSRMGAWPGALPTGNGQPPVAGVSLKGLDTFRQIANRMRESGASGADLARRITGNIDDFISNPRA